MNFENWLIFTLESLWSKVKNAKFIFFGKDSFWDLTNFVNEVKLFDELLQMVTFYFEVTLNDQRSQTQKIYLDILVSGT